MCVGPADPLSRSRNQLARIRDEPQSFEADSRKNGYLADYRLARNGVRASLGREARAPVSQGAGQL